MTRYTELLNETRNRLADISQYPDLALTSSNATDAVYTYFKTSSPSSIERAKSTNEKQHILQQLGVKSINGAAIVFGSFETEGTFEALPWLVPRQSSELFAYHNYVTDDLYGEIPIDALTGQYPDLVRSCMVDAGQTRPIFLMHEFNTLSLQHKKAISRLAIRTHAVQFSLLERSKKVDRVTDFKPH
jgi:hypothetical protein